MKQKPDAVALTVRLPKRVKADLEKQAKEERRSLGQHIVVVLETAMAQGGVTTMPKQQAAAVA